MSLYKGLSAEDEELLLGKLKLLPPDANNNANTHNILCFQANFNDSRIVSVIENIKTIVILQKIYAIILFNMTKITAYIFFLIITYLFLIPANNTPPLFWGFDKLVHIIFFAILTILVKLSFKQSLASQKIYWFGIFFSYALSIELLQFSMKLGRSFSILDIIADIVGVYIAIKLINLSKPR